MEHAALDTQITADWLESILTSYHVFVEGLARDPNLMVRQFTIEAGCAEDEAVLSDLLAVDVEYVLAGEEVSGHLIAKLLPQDPFSRFFVAESRFDLREIKFYTRLLPDLNNLLMNQPLTEEESLSPPQVETARCVHARYHPGCESILVLDNLKYQGFKMASFPKGLSKEEALSSVRAIARVHASGLALKQSKGHPLTETYSFLFETQRATESYHNLLERGFPSIREFLTSCDKTELLKKLEIVREGSKDTLSRLLTPREPIATIIHTDFWSNNLMFRQENREGDVSVRILDWQMVSYSQCTHDVALLFITSLSPKTRRELEAELLKDYWQTLIAEAQQLGVNIQDGLGYNYSDLEADYQSSQLLALLLCIGSIDIALGCEATENRFVQVLEDLVDRSVI